MPSARSVTRKSDASAAAAADSAIQQGAGGTSSADSSSLALIVFCLAVALVVGFVAWETRHR
jgi:hypothetical protein